MRLSSSIGIFSYVLAELYHEKEKYHCFLKISTFILFLHVYSKTFWELCSVVVVLHKTYIKISTGAVIFNVIFLFSYRLVSHLAWPFSGDEQIYVCNGVFFSNITWENWEGVIVFLSYVISIKFNCEFNKTPHSRDYVKCWDYKRFAFGSPETM